MEKVILGLDPGTRFVGFGVLHFQLREQQWHYRVLGHGVMIPEKPESSVNERLLELGLSFAEILGKYQPQQVVVEKSFFHKNADTAFKLGQSRGVFIYEARRSGAQVIEYATRAVKKSVTGQGDADKLMVAQAIGHLLKVKDFASYDASDALALAYHHSLELRKEHLYDRANRRTIDRN
jgi:crossover junction endodeoxyribonuclease RuvC